MIKKGSFLDLNFYQNVFPPMSLHIIYGILYDSYFTMLSFAKFFLKKWKFGDLCELKSEFKMSELMEKK